MTLEPGSDRGSEYATNRVRVDSQDQVGEPESTPTTASGSTATFHDPHFPQGFPPTAFLSDVGQDHNHHHGTGGIASMMPDPVAGLDSGISIATDVVNDVMPDFWQAPFLVSFENMASGAGLIKHPEWRSVVG